MSGLFHRLHSSEPATGNAWPPIHFSRRGNSRFDHADGHGGLCIAETLPGALMEMFDDHWGPVGSVGRSVTERELSETWASLVSTPKIDLFDATAGNLSKIGTDAQLLTGDYKTTREWALRIMRHPAQVHGIYFRSRHDPSRLNCVLFERAPFVPAVLDPDLTTDKADTWTRKPSHKSRLVHGPAVRLRDHPLLNQTLIELQVARIP